jgi:hypothetical protein
MVLRSILTTFAVAAVIAPTAAAGDAVIAPDTAAKQVTALDGTVVWVSGEFGAQVLMQKTSAGITRVMGAPPAVSYTSVDLGRDRHGKLVLTYFRCSSGMRCVARRDDLRGHRSGFRGLALKRCSLTTAPAMWRTRIAYGLECRKGDRPTLDRGRSGLYVKVGSGAPRRLPLPRDAVRFGVVLIDSVDLRGTRVAAVAADIYEYAFSQTTAGTRQESFLAAASEGDSDEHVRGLALGSGGTLWALVTAQHAGDPNRAVIHRLADGCHDWQTLANSPGPDQESGHRAVDVTVDARAIYLVVPQAGIVSHEFTPDRRCASRS